jgi:hypothetical protein
MLTYTKESDLPYIVRTLNSMFVNATSSLGNHASRLAREETSAYKLYEHQVNFAYHIHAITMAPKYIIPKLISVCIEFINNIESAK